MAADRMNQTSSTLLRPTKTLNELFHYARNYGSPDAQEIVKAWDDLTDHSPEFVIETAQEHLDQKFDTDRR